MKQTKHIEADPYNSDRPKILEVESGKNLKALYFPVSALAPLPSGPPWIAPPKDTRLHHFFFVNSL